MWATGHPPAPPTTKIVWAASWACVLLCGTDSLAETGRNQISVRFLRLHCPSCLHLRSLLRKASMLHASSCVHAAQMQACSLLQHISKQMVLKHILLDEHQNTLLPDLALKHTARYAYTCTSTYTYTHLFQPQQYVQLPYYPPASRPAVALGSHGLMRRSQPDGDPVSPIPTQAPQPARSS